MIEDYWAEVGRQIGERKLALMAAAAKLAMRDRAMYEHMKMLANARAKKVRAAKKAAASKKRGRRAS